MSGGRARWLLLVSRKLTQNSITSRFVPQHQATRLLTTFSSSSSQQQQQHDSQDYFKNQDIAQFSESNSASGQINQIGKKMSTRDKINFLVNTLLDLKDSRESVYGALDAWVAWEQNFPISSLKRVIHMLEKEEQWHRIVQVIKWMLSKGQGKTMGTYGQLIRALDKDHRAGEAHQIWIKKVGIDLHSVSWSLCSQMIGIYYRNNMLDNLVKLFKGLEAFDRIPPEKQIVQRVADAYELLGLPEERDRVLEKYNHLFTRTVQESKKSKKTASRKNKNSDSEGLREQASSFECTTDGAVDIKES